VPFFAKSFFTIGTQDAVRQALVRLVKAKELQRVATGMYVRPQTDLIIGKITPGIEAIAKGIAKRDKARIVPTGLYALNRLGLSTQMPTNIIYLTDGAARKIKIGNRHITFKKATPRNVAAVGEISRLCIQALREIGKDHVTEDEIKKIQHVLLKEKPTRLEHDIRLAPVWIREIMRPVLKKLQHDY
jgi:hypothetical protein